MSRDAWSTARVPVSHRIPVRWRPGPAAASPLVVLCHGMGETPETFLESWPRVAALPVHLVLPAGPYAFEKRDGDGIRIGHAWYLYDGNPEPFGETIAGSAAWLRETVLHLESRHGWTPSRRALIGYSQGAYLGYVAALNNQDVFHRLIAVAGRLRESFVEEALSRGGGLQALLLHGDRDRAVLPEAQDRSLAALRRAGYAAEAVRLPGGHRPTPEMDRRAADWLREGWRLDGPPVPAPGPAC